MKKKSMRQHRIGVIGAALALSAAFAGCDVTNPGPIQDEFIGDESAQLGLINGVQRQIAEVYTGNAFAFGLISREVFPGGQIGAWGNPVQIHAGHVEPNFDNGSFDDLHTARYIAETAIAKFTDAGASADRLFEAHLWAGFTYRILGEWWCDAVIPDPDPAVLDSPAYFPGDSGPYFDRAVEHFTAALGFATTAEQEQQARAGRASAYLWLGNWALAYADALTVDEELTFVTENDPSETPLYNYLAEANSGTFRSYTVRFTWFEDYYTNTGDPRTPWGVDPNFAVAVGSLSGFPGGSVPYRPQLKFNGPDSPTRRTQDVNLASGWEMKLVAAEAILRGAGSGAFGDAMTLINEVRTRNLSDNDGLALAALTAANATEAWTHLKRERRIELWLEGRAAGDERRWTDTSAPGTLDIPDWENPAHPGHTPLFIQYPRERLCFDVPESERDRNPNVPAVG